jgi:hypothetical protein
MKDIQIPIDHSSGDNMAESRYLEINMDQEEKL